MVYIADRATRITVLATLLEGKNESEREMLKNNSFENSPYKMSVLDLRSKRTEMHPSAWGDRTLRLGHGMLLQDWASVKSGDSVDVSQIP